MNDICRIVQGHDIIDLIKGREELVADAAAKNLKKS